MFILDEEAKKWLEESVKNLYKKVTLKNNLQEAIGKTRNVMKGLPASAKAKGGNSNLLLAHYNVHIQPLLLCDEEGNVLAYNNNQETTVSLESYLDLTPYAINYFSLEDQQKDVFFIARKIVRYLLLKFEVIDSNITEDDIVLWGSKTINISSKGKKHNTNHKALLENYIKTNNPPLKAEYFTEDRDIGLAINNEIIYRLKLIDITLYFYQNELTNAAKYKSSGITLTDNELNKLDNYDLLSVDILNQIYKKYPFKNDFYGKQGDRKKISIINYSTKSIIDVINPNAQDSKNLYFFGPLYSWNAEKTGATEATLYNLQPQNNDNTHWKLGRKLFKRSFDNVNSFKDVLVQQSWINQIIDYLDPKNKCKIIVPLVTLKLTNDGFIAKKEYDWDLPKTKQPIMYLRYDSQNSGEEVRGVKYIENFANTNQNMFLSVSIQDPQGNVSGFLNNITTDADYRRAKNQYARDLKAANLHMYPCAFSTEGSNEVQFESGVIGSKDKKVSNGGHLMSSVRFDSLVGYFNKQPETRLGYVTFTLDNKSLAALLENENFFKAGRNLVAEVSNIIFDWYLGLTDNSTGNIQLRKGDDAFKGFQQYAITYGDKDCFNHIDERVTESYIDIVAYYCLLEKALENIVNTIRKIDNTQFILNQDTRSIISSILDNTFTLDNLINLNIPRNVFNINSFVNQLNNFLTTLQTLGMAADEIDLLKTDYIIPTIKNAVNQINDNCADTRDFLNTFIDEANANQHNINKEELINTFIQNLLAFNTALTTYLTSQFILKTTAINHFNNIKDNCTYGKNILLDQLQNNLNFISKGLTKVNGEADKKADELFTNKIRKTIFDKVIKILPNTNDRIKTGLTTLLSQYITEDLNTKNNLKESLKNKLQKIKK